jgi:hypothetical protein
MNAEEIGLESVRPRLDFLLGLSFVTGSEPLGRVRKRRLKDKASQTQQHILQPSLRDATDTTANPALETPGYCHEVPSGRKARPSRVIATCSIGCNWNG